MDNLEDKLTDEQKRERAEARQRLDAEVERVKQQEAAGERLPNPSRQEIQAARDASQNIISVADAMAPVVDRLTKLAEETSAFCDKVKQELVGSVLDKCEFHDCNLTVNMERTFYESRLSGKLEVIYDGCPMCQAESKASLVNENWRKMGIPEKLVGVSFQSFRRDLPSQEKAFKKVCNQFHKQRGFLILRGDPGTGKSHLAVACIKENGHGIFVTEGDLVGELRQTYTDNSSQQKLVDKYRNASVLVIDELTPDVKGSDIPAFLYRILAHRYDNDFLTIITSNESLETILEILGRRLADRIRPSYSVATMEWESYRRKEDE